MAMTTIRRRALRLSCLLALLAPVTCMISAAVAKTQSKAPPLNLTLKAGDVPLRWPPAGYAYAAVARPDPWEELGDAAGGSGDDAIPRHHLDEHVPGDLNMISDILDGGTTIPLFRFTLKTPM